jgi:hypothetical protein
VSPCFSRSPDSRASAPYARDVDIPDGGLAAPAPTAPREGDPADADVTAGPVLRSSRSSVSVPISQTSFTTAARRYGARTWEVCPPAPEACQRRPASVQFRGDGSCAPGVDPVPIRARSGVEPEGFGPEKDLAPDAGALALGNRAVRVCENRRYAGALGDGEGRNRTGDTTIFSRVDGMRGQARGHPREKPCKSANRVGVAVSRSTAYVRGRVPVVCPAFVAARRSRTTRLSTVAARRKSVSRVPTADSTCEIVDRGSGFDDSGPGYRAS